MPGRLCPRQGKVCLGMRIRHALLQGQVSHGAIFVLGAPSVNDCDAHPIVLSFSNSVFDHSNARAR